MSLFTRDDPRYWSHRPADHTVAGFFVFGPHESRPSLFREVETGEANRSDEAPSQVLARQRYQRDQRRQRITRGLAFVQAVLRGAA
jgi:hypothetical protein